MTVNCRRMLAKARGIILAVVIIFLFASGLLVALGMNDDVDDADVGVVFGNTVNRDGSPSRRLAARLDVAIDLYSRGKIKHVIVSGGIGREGRDEAVAMRDYLLQRGIPDERITSDNLGITTAATAKNAAAIVKARQWKNVLVISQYFHIPRCRLAFSRAGIIHVRAAHPNYFELRDVYSIPREVIGYAAYLVGLRD